MGLLCFVLFVLNIFLGFILLPPCEVHLCTFFFLKKTLNVFLKCNGVDGVAQHRILKRNQQDFIRSEIEKATTKTHCLYNPVHTDFDYENDILFHTGVLVVYKPHRHLWVLFPLYFCGD